MSQLKSKLIVVFLIFPLTVQAQDLGHEYELNAAPIREGEKPVIPLDTEDPSYNLWRQLRDMSDGPQREPGIIDLKQYDFGFSYNVIPTFFSAPSYLRRNADKSRRGCRRLPLAVTVARPRAPSRSAARPAAGRAGPAG